MRHKKTFLLFEVLIALSLMAALICLLFSFMVQSLRVEKKMEKARAHILERQHLQIRLQDILTSLSPDGANPILYTQKLGSEEMSIVAHFDNGIDPDPLFSGQVIGRLFIDENHNLCLVYWPSGPQKNRSWRKEVLVRDVSDLFIQFLQLTDTAGAKASWATSWSKEKRDIPSTIRIIFKQKGETLQYAFRLPNINPIPTWSSRI